jgi:predicted hotdog family 3-hydroxylacyl-ACP dehydratase
MTSSAASLDHDAIAARVPHAGAMCLLHQVVGWDEHRIECIAFGQAPAGAGSHPLAHDGRLPATAAIEYAAQAMALHGRLIQERLAAAAGEADGEARPASREPARGFLAGLRSVRLYRRWIDGDPPLLTVRVSRFAGDEVQVLYDFEVLAADPIVQGRAVVVLDAGARATADRHG